MAAARSGNDARIGLAAFAGAKRALQPSRGRPFIGFRMTDDEQSAYLDAAAALLGLRIPVADRAEVAAAFAVLTAQARLLADFELPEGTEAAARFIP